MSEGLRVGLVGAGFAARLHARAYRHLGDLNVRVAAVASSGSTRAAALARDFDIADLCSFDDLLTRPDIAIIDLCVPNSLHAPLAIAAAEAGKHVICEKPLTGYFGGAGAAEPVGATAKARMLGEAVASAEAMIAAAQEHSVMLMYAENWVYAPAVQRALSLSRDARGTILEIRAEESHSGSHASYAREWRLAGGGALIRLGAHPLGAALYIKRQEGLARDGRPIGVRSVTAEVSDVTRVPAFQAEETKWLATGWQDVETWATAILTFEDGTHATIVSSDAVLGGLTDRLELYLSNARVACDLTHNSLVQAYAPDPGVFASTYLAEKLETKAGWSYPSIDEDLMLGYPQELRDFCSAVIEGRAPLSDGQLGLEVVRATYAAYRSAEEGVRVML